MICSVLIYCLFCAEFINSCLLKGRGTVATGRIEQGCIKVGEEVEILGLHQVCVYALF